MEEVIIPNLCFIKAHVVSEAAVPGAHKDCKQFSSSLSYISNVSWGTVFKLE